MRDIIILCWYARLHIFRVIYTHYSVGMEYRYNISKVNDLIEKNFSYFLPSNKRTIIHCHLWFRIYLY